MPFSADPSVRTRDNGPRLKNGKFHLNTGGHFSSARLAEHWHRLLREAVVSLSVAILQPDWTWPWVTQLEQGALGWKTAEGGRDLLES